MHTGYPGGPVISTPFTVTTRPGGPGGPGWPGCPGKPGVPMPGLPISPCNTRCEGQHLCYLSWNYRMCNLPKIYWKMKRNKHVYDKILNKISTDFLASRSRFTWLTRCTRQARCTVSTWRSSGSRQPWSALKYVRLVNRRSVSSVQVWLV